MRRRICIVGAAIAAVPFVIGLGVAGAAAKTKSKHKGGNTGTLTCHISLATVPPPGSATVNQPPAHGTQYGSVRCPTFGSGVEKVTFKVADSGDTVGSYAQYFGTGSIRGKFDLSPTEASGALSSTSFASETWAGTVTLTGGTGSHAKAAAKKSTLKCTSGDTVHLTCTEKLKLKKS